MTLSPKKTDIYEVGSILVNVWGWEQTNVEFYCIVERNGEWVKVMPMSKTLSEEKSFMSYEAMPNEISTDKKPIRKKLKKHNGKDYGFSFGTYMGAGWCSLWSGKPITESHYA